jgi:hypothetical protein
MVMCDAGLAVLVGGSEGEVEVRKQQQEERQEIEGLGAVGDIHSKSNSYIGLVSCCFVAETFVGGAPFTD